MHTSTKLSFEFFPARTAEGIHKQNQTRQKLARFHPDFFSVTYGAGGSTKEGTLQAINAIVAEKHQAAPHLSCIGITREDALNLLKHYQSLNIKQIVALRGDIPSGMGLSGASQFVHAIDLVRFIKEKFGDGFHITVAGYPEYHPQAFNAQKDLDYFAEKAKAGADSAITQYFYNADAYFAFIDETSKRGVNIPIYPGIMPIAGFTQLARFSDACGTEIPRWLRLKLQSYGDDTAAIRALGLDLVTEMCAHLLAGGAPGLHFYTLNQAELVETLCTRLNLSGQLPKEA